MPFNDIIKMWMLGKTSGRSKDEAQRRYDDNNKSVEEPERASLVTKKNKINTNRKILSRFFLPFPAVIFKNGSLLKTDISILFPVLLFLGRQFNYGFNRIIWSTVPFSRSNDSTKGLHNGHRELFRCKDACAPNSQRAIDTHSKKKRRRRNSPHSNSRDYSICVD